MTNQEKVNIAAFAAAVVWAKQVENNARKKVNSKQRDLDRCIERNTRNCGNGSRCEIAHTRNVTSCDCAGNTWNYGSCPCGPSSSSQNNN